MTNEVNAGGGIGFLGLLTVLFIGLKLTGYIAWSWFWVLSPIIIPWALAGVILVVAAVAFGAAAAFKRTIK